MTRVKALNEKIKGLKQREDAQKKEIEAIREKVGVEKDNIPDLIKEKSANWETIQQCNEARNKLWEVDKKKKWEAGLEERKKRDAERKAREEAMRPDPFTEELMLCDQLSVYLSRYTQEAKAPKAVTSFRAEAPSGARILKRDTEEFDVMYTVTGKGKKARGSKKSKKPSNLNHSFDILSSFAKCKVTAPLAVDGVPAAAEALVKAKGVFEKLQKTALEKKAKEKAEAEKKAAEGEAAAAEATTSGNGAAAENGAANGHSNGHAAGESGAAANDGAEKEGEAPGSDGDAEA